MMNPIRNKNLEQKAQTKLMREIPFTAADLAANDDGFFSAAQQQRLKPKTDLYIALSAIGAFFCFVLALVFFYVGADDERFLLPTGVCLVAFGVCFYGVFWSMTLASRIKKGFGVKTAEGAAELFITYSGRHNEIPVYNLKIRNVKFQLSEAVYNAFETGHYRVYYFPLLRNELLSVEPAE
ncbi:MAG TPA: hypothetical protein VIL74_20050 [Pyrinomonadaceae bacterium]